MDRVAPTSSQPHIRAIQLLLLSGVIALFLGWLASHAEVLFADGLRYIAQARAIDRGSKEEALTRAVDHPAYPFAIAVTHRILGGDRAESWQSAAQIASILSGVLLLIPLALVVRALFGEATVLPACLLVYLVPLTGHVFADTLSESTFLLFWTWGLWGSIKFLSDGRLRWFPLIVGASALAFLTRPEALLLPASLVVAVVLSPRWAVRQIRLSRSLTAGVVLLVGLSCLVGPYVLLKGGITSKPSVARLLGTAPSSSPLAVERQRPLAENQSAAKTSLLAARAVYKAISEAVTPPLLVLAVVGIGFLRLDPAAARSWRLVAVIVVASVLALARVHATGGYCSPRHAMIVAILVIPASAHGIRNLIEFATNRLGGRLRPIGWGLVFGVMLMAYGPQIVAPINPGLGGYRDAGQWLSHHADVRARVVDVTGWSQFYSDRPRDYTFENLVAAKDDPHVRWVVVREAHLRGPWAYCEQLRELVRNRDPVQEFAGASGSRATRILIFDRLGPLADRSRSTGSAVAR